ncbi:ribosome hibernation-promoting factor, HPF/YfiA family [Rhodocaloribacter sp.]
MNITFQGTNLDLNDDLRNFVEEKLNDAFKAFGNIKTDPIRVAVELERTTRHHRKDDTLYRAEANVSVPGRLIRVEETSPDLYQAIVEMKETLTREIRQWRERHLDQRRNGGRAAKEMLRNLEE